MVEALVRLDTYQVTAIPDSDVRHNPTEKNQVSDHEPYRLQMVQRSAPTQCAATLSWFGNSAANENRVGAYVKFAQMCWYLAQKLQPFNFFNA